MRSVLLVWLGKSSRTPERWLRTGNPRQTGSRYERGVREKSVKSKRASSVRKESRGIWNSTEEYATAQKRVLSYAGV